MTFEKHLRSVSRAASQTLGFMRKSWRVFHDRLLLWRCFRGFVLPVLEYCSAVWCSAADIHLKLLDRAVNGAFFPTGGGGCLSVTLLIVDLWHYFVCCIRSSAIRSSDARVTRGALVAHRYTYAEPHSTAGLLFPSQCLSGTILLTPYSMVWDWRVSRAGPMIFYWLSCSIPTIAFYYFSLYLLPVYRLVLWGWGLRTDRGYITVSQPCTADLF